jgi:hypothetical protein
VFHRWPGWVKQQPLPFLQWMTRHAIAYMSDPKGWLEDGPIELPLADSPAATGGLWGAGVRPISVRPSQLRPVARFGPPPGVERLPIEEVI